MAAAPTLRPTLPATAKDSAATAVIPGALDLLEEAVHLLRRAPAATLACYLGATLPFILGLLYFWADLSRDPAAQSYAAEAALGLAGLFLVMKTGQAVFATRLRDELLGAGGGARWTVQRLGRLFLIQATLQPSGLFVLPLAALATLPFGWAYGFYQNLTVLGDEAGGSSRVALARARRAAGLWPRQNHAAMAILLLLALVVWIDGRALMQVMPGLAKMFSGVENVFTRGEQFGANSTLLAASLALLYLVLDPLVKAFYVMRCFYGDSRRTGEDLRRELRRLPAPSAVAVAAAFLMGFSSLATPARAEPPSPSGAAPAPIVIAPPALDRSIDDVLRRREFAWRLPRPADREQAKKEPGFLARWFEQVGKAFDKLRQWWRALWERAEAPEKRRFEPKTPGNFLPTLLKPLAYTVIAAGVLAGLWVFWNHRRRLAASLLANAGPAPAPAAPVPDAAELADEALLATRLPEDEWLRLGRELRARGERRLALRAFYLSILAGLAARGLVQVARHKSNGDYLRETNRRGRDRAGLTETFGEAVSVFERPWYGQHPADDDALDGLLARRERIVGVSGGAPVPSTSS